MIAYRTSMFFPDYDEPRTLLATVKGRASLRINPFTFHAEMSESEERAAIEQLRQAGATVKQRKDGSAGAISCATCKSAVDDSWLTLIAACQRLRELDLSGTAVTDTGVARLCSLGNLTDLDLSNTRATEASLGPLAALPRLKMLVLTGCSIEIDRVRELRKRMINTRIVFLGGG